MRDVPVLFCNLGQRMAELVIASARVVSIVGGSIASIGADLLLRVLTLTTSGILALGQNLFMSSFYPDTVGLVTLRAVEDELDLLETVKIYESYLQEYISKHKDWIDESDTARLSIHSVQSTLTRIHELLDVVEKRVKEHNQLWFRDMRRLDFTHEAKQLRSQKRILDTRMRLFLDLFGGNTLSKHS